MSICTHLKLLQSLQAKGYEKLRVRNEYSQKPVALVEVM